MSRRTVVDCDVCGQEIAVPLEVSLLVGFTPDAAGGVSSGDYDNYDLCPSCSSKLIRRMTDRVHGRFGTDEDGRWISDQIKEMGKVNGAKRRK